MIESQQDPVHQLNTESQQQTIETHDKPENGKDEKDENAIAVNYPAPLYEVWGDINEEIYDSDMPFFEANNRYD